MFTHQELFRLKQAQDVLTRALKQDFRDNPLLENDLVVALNSLSNVIDQIKVKQEPGIKKEILNLMMIIKG